MDISKKWFFKVLIVFSILGILISGVLTLAKYNDNIAALCGDDVDNGCNTVQNSEYANLFVVKDDSGKEEFKVTLTFLGIFYYLIMVILSFMLCKEFVRKEVSDKAMKLKWMLFVVSVIGVTFSLTYTLIQAFIIEAFCVYCLISAFISMVMFGFVLYIAFNYNKS